MPGIYNMKMKHRIPIPRGAVYCGRGSPYGNPYIGGVHGSRAMVIAKYERDALPLISQDDLDAIVGRDLLCHCVPEACHCEPLFRRVNGWDWRTGETVDNSPNVAN